MNSNSKWMRAMSVLIVVSLVTAGVAPAGFARGSDEVLRSGDSDTENIPEVKLPNRPVILAQNAAAPTPTQAFPAASRTTRPAYTPPARQAAAKSRKWIFIVVAAAGAGAAAAFLAGRGDSEPGLFSPTITVGSPTVGQPQ